LVNEGGQLGLVDEHVTTTPAVGMDKSVARLSPTDFPLEIFFAHFNSSVLSGLFRLKACKPSSYHIRALKCARRFHSSLPSRRRRATRNRAGLEEPKHDG
jgi:hypothetical protein